MQNVGWWNDEDGKHLWVLNFDPPPCWPSGSSVTCPECFKTIFRYLFRSFPADISYRIPFSFLKRGTPEICGTVSPVRELSSQVSHGVASVKDGWWMLVIFRDFWGFCPGLLKRSLPMTRVSGDQFEYGNGFLTDAKIWGTSVPFFSDKSILMSYIHIYIYTYIYTHTTHCFLRPNAWGCSRDHKKK